MVNAPNAGGFQVGCGELGLLFFVGVNAFLIAIMNGLYPDSNFEQKSHINHLSENKNFVQIYGDVKINLLFFDLR